MAGEEDSLLNFFMLWDGYLNYKLKQFARAQPFSCHIHPYVDVTLNGLSDQMTYSPLEVHEPSYNLHLKVFQAQPVVGKRVLSFYIEPSNETISLIIASNA